ncbi:DUF4233 domain-containing protein [Naasia sp. SYSU D00948]|uniref:DUF4233 domain-containing protein n=1 Tax=Naasia sp. SYSU D00948 TaxID=2817379 RepID=UPI0027DDE099|nr:DUF4233 domain-containing protein [Naasia sp. SYSU D00948]
MARERARRPRGPRGVRESLGTIVLGLEIVVVFLGALVAWGLNALPAGVAIGAGLGLVALSVAAIRTLDSTIGVVLGSLVQAVLLLSGLLLPELYIVGALFVALWAYCMIVGGRIDRRNAAAE